MKTYLDLSKEQLETFMALPAEGTLKMVNLLKFKDKIETSNQTGADLYKEYMIAANPFFLKANAKIVFSGKPQSTLIGPDALEWDKVLIVEYATRNDFVNMITSEGYPAHIRRASLEDSRLIFCK